MKVCFPVITLFLLSINVAFGNLDEDIGKQAVTHYASNTTKVISGDLTNPNSGCLIHKGTAVVDGDEYPYIIKNAAKLSFDSLPWKKFQREYRQHVALQKAQCKVHLCGISGARGDDPERNPASLLIFPYYPADLHVVLFAGHKMTEQLSANGHNRYQSMPFSLELRSDNLFYFAQNIIDALIELDSYGVIHTCLSPEHIYIEFPPDNADADEDDFPDLKIGGLGNVVKAGRAPEDISIPDAMLPPEALASISFKRFFDVNRELMKYQLGILLGMLSNKEFFQLFIDDNRADIKPHVNDPKEFTTLLQSKLMDELCCGCLQLVPSDKPKKDDVCERLSICDDVSWSPNVLLFLSWYLIHPDPSVRPELKDVKEFIDLF